MDRSTHPTVGTARELLVGMLDLQRATVLRKTEGLDAEGMRASLSTSDLTLAGLLKHLTLVERDWFEGDLLGNPLGPPWDAVDWDADPDWEFRTALEDDPDELRSAYRAAFERSNEIIADVDLEALSVRQVDDVDPRSLHWILLHMIEETARHAGHADLIRQAVDGQTGY